MGYGVQIVMDDVVIPADRQTECLAAINALHAPERLARDASGGDNRGNRWYAWVDNPPVGGFPSLADALTAWNHSVAVTPDGDLAITDHEGENWGDYALLYHAIAPYVRDGGIVSCLGNDGDRWRYVYRGGAVVEQRATVAWEE